MEKVEKKKPKKKKTLFKAPDQKFLNINKTCHWLTLDHNEKLCK